MGYPIWTNYWPGSGALGLVDVCIIDDPNQVYEIMASAGPITLADIGSAANVVVNASTTGFSKWALGAPAAGAGSDVLPSRSSASAMTASTSATATTPPLRTTSSR